MENKELIVLINKELAIELPEKISMEALEGIKNGSKSANNTIKSIDEIAQKIGIIGEFSTPGSIVGVSGRNGAELAIKEINESVGINGRSIEVLSVNH